MCVSSRASPLRRQRGPLIRRQLRRVCFQEAQAKRELAACGVQVPAGEFVTGVEAAVEAAIRIGFPVALKSAAAIAHKTEIGGVKLHLRDAAEVRGGAMQLAHIGAPSCWSSR
jgi:acyl-CoA synthetase (NDP forming)